MGNEWSEDKLLLESRVLLGEHDGKVFVYVLL